MPNPKANPDDMRRARELMHRIVRHNHGKDFVAFYDEVLHKHLQAFPPSPPSRADLFESARMQAQELGRRTAKMFGELLAKRYGDQFPVFSFDEVNINHCPTYEFYTAALTGEGIKKYKKDRAGVIPLLPITAENLRRVEETIQGLLKLPLQPYSLTFASTYHPIFKYLHGQNTFIASDHRLPRVGLVWG